MSRLGPRDPELFGRGPSPLASVVFYCLLSLTCLFVDHRYHGLSLVRQGIAAVFYPFQELATVPSVVGQWIMTRFENRRALETENARLRKQLLEQTGAVEENTLFKLEQAKLHGLLELKQQQPATRHVTTILAASHDPFVKKIILDGGRNLGIPPGSPVVTTDGLVGQVTAVFPFSSEVTLITDKSQSIPVMVLRNGLRAMAVGDGENGTLSLPYLPRTSDIQQGDVLVTSGIDGLFPPGLKVGIVQSVTRDAQSPFAQVTCTATPAATSHRHVLVIDAPRIQDSDH